MKRILFAAALPLITLVVSSCAPGPRVGPPPGQVPPTSPSEAVYGGMVDELLPVMASDNLEERQKAQRDFEQLCFIASRPGKEADRVALCRAICARVGSQTAMPARVWLLRQLDRLGGAESVPTLAELTSDKDPHIRELARRALQTNPADSAADALRDALARTKDGAGQIALLNALAARRDEASVPRMIELAQARDPAVAATAISALGELATSPAIDALHALWRGARETVRTSTANALLRAAARLTARGQRDRAGSICTDIYLSSAPTALRAAALHGLVAARSAAALPRLLEVITNEDADVQLRASAARLVADIPGPVVTVAIAQHVQQVPPSAQVLLLHALAERADAIARPVATRLLQSGDDEVRRAAGYALQTLGDHTSVLPLARAAADSTGPASEAARHALARLPGESVDDTILTHLTASDVQPSVRVELIRSTSARLCAPAVPVLLGQARHEDDHIRTAAFDALGQLATADCAPELVDLLVVEHSDAVRDAAMGAIVAVCARGADEGSRAAPVLAVWNDSDASVRATLTLVLGRIGGADALAKIRAAHQSENADLVDAAVRALAKWETTAVLDDLLSIAQQCESEEHRILALRGYVRLLEILGDENPRAAVERYRTALDLAPNTQETKFVLGGLATLHHIQALGIAKRYLNDEELRAEAEAAVVSIAKRVAPLHRRRARAALEDIIAQSASDATRTRAEEALAAFAGLEGNLTAWLVAGPYFEDGREWEYVHDHAFAPEPPEASIIAWHPLRITHDEKPWIFDLTHIGGNDRCVYARATVWSDKFQEARLDVGSDDGVKVWLNDELVHELKEARGHQPFQDQTPVTLHAGWNTILLKVVQITGGWGFSAGLRTPAGDTLEGLRYDLPTGTR